MMLKAIFCDFYGTVVYEDDEPISMIIERIYQTGNAESKKEIGKYWWQCFSALCTDSYGDGFRTQRELEIQSLIETLERFGSKENDVPTFIKQFPDYTRFKRSNKKIYISHIFNGMADVTFEYFKTGTVIQIIHDKRFH